LEVLPAESKNGIRMSVFRNDDIEVHQAPFFFLDVGIKNVALHNNGGE
jgi:hypothetical protein